MKHSFLLRSIVLICALVLGSASAWGTDITLSTTVIEVTDFSGVGSSYPTSATNKTIGGYTWSVYNCLNLGKYSGVTYNNLQMKKDFGYIISPTISSSNGFTVTVTYSSTSALTLQIGNETAQEGGTTSSNAQAGTGATVTATTTSTSTTFKLSAGGATAYVSSIVITPNHTLTYSSSNGSIGGVVYGTSTVFASGAAIAQGGKVTLTAQPADGYEFSSWEVSGTGSSLSSTTTNPTTFTMGTANATVTANFSATGGGNSDPSISADNVNIAYNATNGSIGYTLTNGNGNVSASVTSGDWLTLGTITESAVPFTCSANTSTTTARTAQVTLSYTGASDKVVTITQAKRPNYISEISAASTQYTVVGTVVATNSKGFVIGDGTGYVYTYLNSAPSQSINDKVKIAGTTGTYGQVIQFTSGATITTESSSAYDGTPAATVINSVPDYSTSLHLSSYLQFEGQLEKNNSNYFITVGSDEIQISYPTSSQASALNALDSKTVRVKGYFSGINSSNYFTVMLESVEEVTTPSISVNPSTAESFTYVAGDGPSDDQMFKVSGSNLTSSTITASVSSDYEITDDSEYSSSVTIGSGDYISVRLKAGLAKGEHNGTLTLSTEGAQNVTVNLSGSVTGQTYEIAQYTSPATAHGTITFAPTSPVEDGTEVTLTAEPADGYEFTANSWVFYKEGDQDYVVDNTITVTDGKITMPAYTLWVDATFAPKTTYAITTTEVSHGTVETDENAWEGKSVTILVEPATGYSLASIVVAKTSDLSTKVPVTGNVTNGFTFTMPAYAVTVTATFARFVSWNLAVASYDEITDPDIVTWSSSYATMENSSKSGGTSASNYLGGDSNNRTSSRMYSGNTLTITPSDGYAITSAVFTAASEGYATALKESKWTNASATVDGSVVTVSPSKGYEAFSAAIGATCGFTEVKVYYEEYVEADAAPEWGELPSPETTVGTAIEEIDLSTYVTGHPTPTISVKSSTADPLLYSLVNGKLNFTPNTAGTATFVFTATNTVDEVEESADATLTITVNAAAAVNTPVLTVNDANVTSNSALVSWTSCTDVASYTLQLAEGDTFTGDEESIIENDANSSTAPSGWSYSVSSNTGSYVVLQQNHYVITSSFDASDLTDLTLSFKMRTYGGSDYPSVSIEYSLDNGSTWSGSLGTLSAGNTTMTKKTIDISAAAGNASVRVRIASTSSSSSKGVGIQEIVISGFRAEVVSASSVKNTSFTFKDLSAGTTYAVRVRGNAGWSDVLTFVTDAATPSTKELNIASGAKYNGRYWTTFYDAENGYKLPAGAQAFKLDDNKLVLLGDSGVVIPKETPVVIVSDKTSLTLTETNATVTVGDNDLVGSSAAVTVTEGKVDGKIPHVLSIKGSPAVIGFYKFTGSEIPAGKAYVLVSE